jgi:ankyrin repeat protein
LRKLSRGVCGFVTLKDEGFKSVKQQSLVVAFAIVLIVLVLGLSLSLLNSHRLQGLREELIKAAEDEDVAKVQRLFDKRFGPDCDERCWQLLLAEAFPTRNSELLVALLEGGLDPNQRFHPSIVDFKSDVWAVPTLIQLAMQEQWYEAVRLLLEHGADPDGCDPYHPSPLARACYPATPRVAKLLIDHGADVDGLSTSCSFVFTLPTYLHILSSGAPCRGDKVDKCIKIMRLLLDHGANPMLRNEAGRTPANLLAGQAVHDDEALRLLQVLLEYGVELSAYDLLALERTDELVTLVRENPELINQLMPQKPFDSGPTLLENGTCLLTHAIAFDQPEVFDKLLELGALPNGSPENPGGPLRTAVRRQEEDFVLKLLQLGADPNLASSATGKTPLHDAISRNRVAMVDALLRHGADAACCPAKASGLNPLAYALAWSESEEIIQLLKDSVSPDEHDEAARAANGYRPGR